MGCDIHCHIEVKYKGAWHHLNEPDVNRNYELFGLMAGVRGDTEPIAKPRGLPQDISPITGLDYSLWAGDAHSESWLSGDEIGTLEGWWHEHRHPNAAFMALGYLFGSYFSEWRDLAKDGVEDVRAVFWFDN